MAFFEDLQYEFFQHTVEACLLVGAVCAVFSTYVVLRRLVFAGVALTQLSSAGLGLAALTGLPALPVSLATTIMGVGLLGLVKPGQKGRTDNLIALLYIGGWASSVLLFAVAERGDTELAAILYGDILGVLASDIYAFFPVALVVVALVLALAKELLFVSFDPETAATYRLPVWLYDTVLFSVLGIVIVFATKMLGLLLVFAFLVAPGTAALMVCSRMPGATVFSVGFSAAMSLVGLAAAAQWNLPPGPAVTATGLLLLGVLVVARAAGVGLARKESWRPAIRYDPSAARVGAVVAALVLVAALAGALSTRVGMERTAAMLHGHQAQGASEAPAAASHGLSSHEEPHGHSDTEPSSSRSAAASQALPEALSAKYAAGVGDDLPEIENLLGE